MSDIHLSSKDLYDDNCSWFKIPQHRNRLIKFIDKNILGQPDIKDVVLLGDIFNTWVCPADKEPPTYADIFNANSAILDKFKAIANDGITLFYVNGNHDYDLEPEVIKVAVPGIQTINIYRSGRLHAEHGHRFDEIFNKPDRFSDPGFGRPIGYIISRLVSSFSTSGYSLIDLPTYIDDIVEAAITSQNIFESIIEGLSERANMKENDAIIMPGGTPLTIMEAKARYSRLEEKYNTREFIRELWDRSALGWHADRLCRKTDLNTVIFGHTHKALIDKDFFLVDDRIYANTGSWCKDNAYCVEVDKKPHEALMVKLHKVGLDGEIEKPSKTESI